MLKTLQKNKGIFLLLTVLLSFSGCAKRDPVAVEWVPVRNTPYAPVNGKYGVVSFLNSPNLSVRLAREHEAYQKIYEICGGKYRVVSVNIIKPNYTFGDYLKVLQMKPSFARGFLQGSMLSTAAGKVVIKFECLNDPERNQY